MSMKAMILCAGLGTRLRPWTLEHPKALVPVGGVPMLRRVVESLVSQGFRDVTINVHHFADQIRNYVNNANLPADHIHISDETDELLDTGGGILRAEETLSLDSSPFLVHNVDILSNADLKGLYDFHVESGNEITLLVSYRQSSRKLVFDKEMRLKGWLNSKDGLCRPADLSIEDCDSVLAFSGIYVMSPSVFDSMRREGFQGSFPIMDFFLSSLSDIEIRGLFQSGLEIIDIGKPDTLHRANLKIQ